jgi:hypothetical protein
MDFGKVPNDHHRDESRVGIGDLKLVLRYLKSNISFGPGNRLFFGAGIIIPSDNTIKKNPYIKPVEEHTHFAMSEGVFKFIGEMQYFKRDKGPIVSGLVSQCIVPLHTNKYSFKPGTELSLTGYFLFQKINLLGGLPQLMLTGSKRSANIWPNYEGTGETNLIISGGLMWNRSNKHYSITIGYPFVNKPDVIKGGVNVDGYAKTINITLSARVVLPTND